MVSSNTHQKLLKTILSKIIFLFLEKIKNEESKLRISITYIKNVVREEKFKRENENLKIAYQEKFKTSKKNLN